MMTFDRTLEEVVRICEQHKNQGKISKIVLVRDIRGRIRLVIQPKDEPLDSAELEGELNAELQGYFKGPILLTTSMNLDDRRLATKLVEISQPWAPGYEDPGTGQRVEPKDGRWRKVERRISKQTWLEGGAPSPPWELTADKPAIVTFYSFKGGVGRTTALASCAWQLASRGKRVCVVDVDFEAPGLGSLFGASTERGAIDFVVDFLATGQRGLDGCNAAPGDLPTDATELEVIPAGRLDLSYLEKLARLDFLGAQVSQEGSCESPVEEALKALLHAVHRNLKPDYILLDSRAGLHDLAGLSLHGLAHVDVLFARAAEQSYAGLEIALQTLARRKHADELLGVVVHAFAPQDLESPAGKDEVETFRKRVYEQFLAHIYCDPDKDVPDLEDSSAMHAPAVLRENSALVRFSKLLAVADQLLTGDYKKLCGRIEELCSVPSSEEAEE